MSKSVSSQCQYNRNRKTNSDIGKEKEKQAKRVLKKIFGNVNIVNCKMLNELCEVCHDLNISILFILYL